MTSLSPQVFLAVVATAMAAPQIVPYQHVEIPAEPYIHEEVAAEPYVHIEPELTPEALGVIDRSNLRTAPVAAPQQFAAPVQQQFVPQQQQFVAQQQFISQQQQFLPQQQLFAQPQQFAGPVQGWFAYKYFCALKIFFQNNQIFLLKIFTAGVWTGTCLNNLGEGVPCRQKF